MRLGQRGRSSTVTGAALGLARELWSRGRCIGSQLVRRIGAVRDPAATRCVTHRWTATAHDGVRIRISARAWLF